MMFWAIFISLLIYGASCYRVQLSCEQVRAFVDGHNWKRFHVTRGHVPAQPAAANMKYMVWDDELAEKAARWAALGLFLHNPDRTIWSKRWNNLVGENIFINMVWSPGNTYVAPNITDALESWYNEYKDFNYQQYHLGFPKAIGHYTQMIWADTNRVGCGISQQKVNNYTNTLFVCDYGPTGNFIGQFPYSTNTFKGNLACAHGECNKPYGYFC